MKNSLVREKRKIFQCLLLLLALFTSVMHSRAQAVGGGKTEITLACRNEAMPDVLKKVEQVSDFKVLFTYNEVCDFKVTVNLKSVSVEEAMKAILASYPLTFKIKGKYITVSLVKKAVTMEVSRRTSNRLTGRVTDTTGEPLPGVNVQSDLSGVGGVTDFDGRFDIAIPEGKQVTEVNFTFVGMTKVTLPFKGKPLIVTMQDDSRALKEVVVTGLFNYRAASFTGSATTFSKEELKSVGNQNLLKSLSNLDPSFIIEDNYLNGSNPNAFNDITIRGNASFAGMQGEYTGNPNQPLFIVDGFESSQEAVFDLDMNRVQSVTILKDAAAKAIYGSKASNGVVVVETVEPEKGRLRITYTGDLNIEAPDLSSYDVCNAEEKLQVELNAGRYTGNSPLYQQELTEQYNAIKKNIAEGVDTYWLAKPLRTGVGQKHTLYMEGGDDRMRYSANVSYNGIAGVMKGSDRRTISGNIKLSYRYKDFLFRNSLSITSNKADNSPYGSFSDYANANPYFSPYDDNGNLKKVLGTYTHPDINQTLARSVTYYNPLYNAYIGTKNFTKYTEYTENFYIEWRPLDVLRFTGRMGYTYQSNRDEDFAPGDHTMYVDWTGDTFFKRGHYSISDGETENFSADLTANYSRQFGKHMLLGNVAWSLNSTSSDSHGMMAWGFMNNHVDHITFAKQYAENGRPYGGENTTHSIGITGAVNYSFDERYLADLSIRYNGSSAFGSDNRWGTFWSVGIGWNLHNEHFMQNQDWLNLFKLRASYGLTGNQNFNPYQAKATYKFYEDVIYDNITGAYLMALANDKLKWQQTADLNVGFDLQLFKQLNVRLDVYKQKTKDALLALTLPTSTGFNSYMENLGNVENTGFDATLSWRFYQKGSNFISLNASIGHNKNKVVKISDALKAYNDKVESDAMGADSDKKTNLPVIRYAEGQSMTAIWAVQSLGIDPATGEELFLKKDGVTTTYDYDTDDKIIAGDSNPKYRGNFGLSGEYKGFGMNCSFSYRFGGDYYNQTLVNRVENVDIAHNVDRRVLHDTWQQPGDVATFRKITWRPSTTYPTTRFVERNNELQFASFSCYYDFKYMGWLRKCKLERLKLSFYMNDLFRVSTVKTERGLDYPYARNFSFSLSATF